MVKRVLFVKEEIFEQYKPKLVKYVKLNDSYLSEEKLNILLDELNRAKKQKQAVMHYFLLNVSTKKSIKQKTLQEINT